LVLAIINGFDNQDDAISSGGIPRGDTLFSSTFGGNDTVSIFSPQYDVHLGDGNDVLQGGNGGFAYGEAGNDGLTAFIREGTHSHDGGDGDDRFNVWYGGTDTAAICCRAAMAMTGSATCPRPNI
jgi:hypothetical protein